MSKVFSSETPVWEWYVAPQSPYHSVVRMRWAIVTALVSLAILGCVGAVLAYNWVASYLQSLMQFGIGF